MIGGALEIDTVTAKRRERRQGKEGGRKGMGEKVQKMDRRGPRGT